MPVILACALTPANASAATVVERLPFSSTYTNPCTGELFTVAGFIHHVTRTTDSGHFREQFSFEGVSGSSSSGARYIVPSANSLVTNVDIDAAPITFTFVATQMFIRVGNDPLFPAGDDLFTHIVSRFTINANGTLTIQTLDVRIECR